MERFIEGAIAALSGKANLRGAGRRLSSLP